MTTQFLSAIIYSMNKFTRCFLIAFFFLFFSLQFYLTLFGGFFWPFSSHRLFSQLPQNPKPIVQAIFVDAKGHEIAVHPGKALPIEYSRCSGFIRKLAKEGTPQQKMFLLDYLLKRVNERPWRAFDEMYSAARSPSGAPFIHLRFETHLVEFKKAQYPDSIIVKERTALLP